MSDTRGFTLLEIMVVVVIISLIGTVVAVNVTESHRRTKCRMAGVQVRLVDDAAYRYWVDRRSLPSRLDELVPEYIDADQLTDPWGTALQFQKPGPEGRLFVVASYGEDRQPGGIEFAEDIWSHQPRRD